ncbi:UNVERIFIED_CONTAM: hypothetical protein PO582_21130, partial [Atlantibacter hermannii]
MFTMELFRSLRVAGLFGTVEGFRSLQAAGLFGTVEGFRSLQAAVRINSHRRTRPGWGRSPPRPQHPRLPLSPSPLRG